MSRERLRRTRLPLGLLVELGRKDPPRDHSPTTEPAVGPGWASVPSPPLSPGAGAVLTTGVGLLALAGLALGHGTSRPGFAGAMRTFPDLGIAAAAAWLTLCLLRVIEGALLADSVRGTSPLAWLRGPFVRVEPVCWRLGIPWSVALLAVLLPAAVFAGALAWWGAAPAAASGAAVGAVFHAIEALYPLKPGPGARLLEAATGLDDLPTQLRWALVERFLPVLGGPGEAEGTRTTAVAGLALAGWAAGTGQALHALSASGGEGLTAAGTLWQGAAVLALGVWAVWLAARVGGLFLAAARAGRDTALEPLEPSPDLERAWVRENPLNRHVPELRSAPWRWGVARRGSPVTDGGAETRDFYWLARGAVHLVGRTEGGDPRHLATLRAAAGLGEATLPDEAGTADVVAAEDSVVAILRHADLRDALGEEGEERFREVTLASQALARARPLWGLSADLRARWLAHGSPARFADGDPIIREGERDRWLGIVVKGHLVVERGGRRIGNLGPDELFGEMAYLSGEPRSATVRAVGGALIWRWEPEWLDRELVAAGVADDLRDLARERVGGGR